MTYPIKQNITIVSGDKLPKTITITDSNGDPVDISTWEFSFIVKTDDKAPDSNAYIHLTDSDFTKSLGQASFSVEAIDGDDNKIPNGTYIYTLRVENSTSRRTYMTGKFIVKESGFDGV